MNNQPELEIDEGGNKEWYLNNKLHREDGPAIEHYNGDTEWYLDGKLHRDDGPACEHFNGHHKYWYINGKLHRENGPAIEHWNGTKFWYLNGKQYDSKEAWFRALTPEQQYNYLWNLDE
jgi:antitoxin component YwqK of YwqJK toxin-antitoxin module